MKSILKPVFIITILGGLFSGCVNNDNFTNPNQSITTYELTPTKTVAQVVSENTTALTQFANHDIIEAYVTSSDEGSNFYKSISFQTIPTDGSDPIGFSVPVNFKYFSEGFTPGRKVYIDLNPVVSVTNPDNDAPGLYGAIVDGSLQIGELYQPNPTDIPEVGRISENTWKYYLFPSATIVPEDSFVRTMTLAEAATDANLNTLVDIEDVQFVDGSLGRTYFDVNSGGGSTNHSIVSITGGSSEYFRVSSYAEFATHMVPSGSGTIRGVMTRYQSDYQFLSRVESDVRLDNPRFDVYPPIVGNAIVYLGSFTENFESYAVNQTNFPKYINDPVVGSRLWKLKSSSGKFIDMTSFGGTPEANKTLFFVPVDMTAANTFSFKSKASFYNGNTLKVYYTTNYTPGQDVSTATLVNITSSFNISDGSSSSFIASGAYNIPASLTGNGFFIFEYTGSGIAPLVTTNMDIDDIVVN